MLERYGIVFAPKDLSSIGVSDEFASILFRSPVVRCPRGEIRFGARMFLREREKLSKDDWLSNP